MRLYVFLRPGRKASLSDMQWPAPHNGAPGAWIEAGRGVPPEAIRAYPTEELLWCLDDELWEVELDGSLHRDGRAVVAKRGRLMRRVETWTSAVASELVEACAFRARDAGVEALAGASLVSAANELRSCGSLDALEHVGSTIAKRGSDAAARLAGFAADTALYAREAPDPVRAAAVAAYVAAHTLAGGDNSLAGYEARFADERRWQAEWLSRRLRLNTM